MEANATSAEDNGNEHKAGTPPSANEGELSAGHFRVDGLVALVTGGGTGEPARQASNTHPSISLAATHITAQASD